MSLGGLVRSAVVLAGGYALAAALFWGLLNVPESNVLALLMSAALVVLIVLLVGVVTGVASALAHDMPAGAAVRRALAVLPVFLAGLLIFGALWWITGAAEAWWRAHQGEVDAVFLRSLGATATSPLHASVFWLLWLGRWVLGLSVVIALVVVAMLRGADQSVSGLRLSIRPLPLAAAAAGVLVVTQGLWRLADRRPDSLPATQTEILFAAAKLGVLYLMTAAIGAGAIGVYVRAANRSA